MIFDVRGREILYTASLFSKAAVEIKAVVRGVLGLSRKVVVCDLDNTLWGGVAADDGIETIRLGAPDPLGECFRDFQSKLKALRARGILLAICSKNDEAFALSVIENHPAMALKKEDFVCWKINWREKAENLVGMAQELNLGLDAFVFLDDSPEERHQIRQLLPEVFDPSCPLHRPITFPLSALCRASRQRASARRTLLGRKRTTRSGTAGHYRACREASRSGCGHWKYGSVRDVSSGSRCRAPHNF